MNVFLNISSQDLRVSELGKIFSNNGAHIQDFGVTAVGYSVAFLEPRFVPTGDQLLALPRGTKIFGYPESMAGLSELGLEYYSLQNDPEFVRENNRLTAMAMREILEKRFGKLDKKKVLVVGWGNLFTELRAEFDECEIHLLTLNSEKIEKARQQFGTRAHGAEVDLSKFGVIINTVPKPLVCKKILRTIDKSRPAIYDLASAPFGFDWAGFCKCRVDYKIEPGLPGRFYPQLAALSAYKCIERRLRMDIGKPSVVLGITGSSCTYTKLLPVLEEIGKTYDIIPIMSEAADQENRFCDIVEFRKRLGEITGKDYMKTITDTEKLSHYPNIVAGMVLPATGNTIARLANSVHDGAVTLAMKALLRNNKPIIIGISTNDALCGGAINIGALMGRKNYYFVPFMQDDYKAKPYSIVCDFTRVKETIDLAVKGTQIQPMLG